MNNLSFPTFHHQPLVSFIVQTMQENGGSLPFIEFMKHALYAPGLGYYSTLQWDAQKDFVTAPELSPLFSQCIAKQCQQILSSLQDGVILEFGAGSGRMAAEILKELARLDHLPARYFILEVSAQLRQRQQLTLQTHAHEFLERVCWLDRLPSQPLQGIILANEVLDAMPIQRFSLEEKDVGEFYVSYQDDHFAWRVFSTPDLTLRHAVEALRSDLSVGYVSEINPVLPGWIRSLSAVLSRGVIILIDYGFPRREYYHPQRHQGTLMCHYQHRAHTDPLILVGLQDITAHVDFSAVAQAAMSTGLHVAGYTTQAHFLLACGLPELLSHYYSKDFKAYLQVAQQVKMLTLPSEMGELFKVIALTQHFDVPLQGFEKDERNRL